VEATGAEFTTNADRAANKRPEGNPGGNISYAQSSFDDSQWRLLNLPHDWGIAGPFKQEYPGQTGKLPWWGVAWYRKHLEIPVSDQGKKSIWPWMARWPTQRSGSTASSSRLALRLRFMAGGFDSVSQIRRGQCHRHPPRQSDQLVRWYPGGGIYRNVWLVKTEPVHVAHWGAYVTTPEVNPGSATVKIQVKLDNDTDTDAAATVEK